MRPGQDLAELIRSVAPDLRDGDVIAVPHKIVSKAEGRVRALQSVVPGARARALAARVGRDARLVEVVLDESAAILRAEPGRLICRTHHGFVCANAGVDVSNAADDDEVVLLPRDPDRSARALRAGLARGGSRPAVVVSDSFGRPWRLGQTDVALGLAGLAPLDDWRGRRDGYGRELKATVIAVADAVAGAADLVREKDGRRPVVRVRGLERWVSAHDGPGATALRRPPEEDLFG